MLSTREEIIPLSLGFEARGILWALKWSRGLAMVSEIKEGQWLTYVAGIRSEMVMRQ